MSESKDGTAGLDNWGSASTKYATLATVVTRPCSEELISWVNDISPFSALNVEVFDNGCGTGVLTTALSTTFPNISILAGDLSPGMIEMTERKKIPNVRIQVLDAVNLPFQDNTFTHVLSTFMVQFTPAPLQALKEMYRVTKIGGTVGLAMWGRTILYDLWIEACRHFESGYEYPHTWSPDWEQDDDLKTYIHWAKFKDIQMKTLKPRWNFKGPENLYEFFLRFKNPKFERAIRPWKESGRYDEVEAVYKRLVEEKYNGAVDFDMNVLLFVARK